MGIIVNVLFGDILLRTLTYEHSQSYCSAWVRWWWEGKAVLFVLICVKIPRPYLRYPSTWVWPLKSDKTSLTVALKKIPCRSHTVFSWPIRCSSKKIFFFRIFPWRVSAEDILSRLIETGSKLASEIIASIPRNNASKPCRIVIAKWQCLSVRWPVALAGEQLQSCYFVTGDCSDTNTGYRKKRQNRPRRTVVRATFCCGIQQWSYSCRNERK